MLFLCGVVSIPDDIYTTLSHIRTDLRDEGIRPSDRRFKQSLSILQAKALMEQRQDVKISDVLLLEHTLWENVEQKTMVSEIVHNHALDIVSRTIQTIEDDTNELLKASQNDSSTENVLEATQKMKRMVQELDELKITYHGREDINATVQKVKGIQQKITDSILEPIDAEPSTKEMPF